MPCFVRAESADAAALFLLDKSSDFTVVFAFVEDEPGADAFEKPGVEADEDGGIKFIVALSFDPAAMILPGEL